MEAEKVADSLFPITDVQKNQPNIEARAGIAIAQCGVNINTDEKSLVINALKGARVHKLTIDKLIDNRPYDSLDDLAIKMKFTKSVKDKLQIKFNSGEICFD